MRWYCNVVIKIVALQSVSPCMGHKQILQWQTQNLVSKDFLSGIWGHNGSGAHYSGPGLSVLASVTPQNVGLQLGQNPALLTTEPTRPVPSTDQHSVLALSVPIPREVPESRVDTASCRPQCPLVCPVLAGVLATRPCPAILGEHPWHLWPQGTPSPPSNLALLELYHQHHEL